MEKKNNKIKQYFKDLGSSIFDTNRLFKFATYSWITPLIVLILILTIMVTPSLVNYNTLKTESITSSVKHVDKVLAHTLKQDYKCSVSNQELNCQEKYLPASYTYTNEDGLEFKYNIYVNSDVTGIDFNIGTFEKPSPNENYLIFSKSAFKYRYVYRDPASKNVIEYQLESFYDNLEGLDFSKIKQNSLTYTDLAAQENYLLEQSDYILLNGLKAMMKETILVSISANAIMFVMFILIVALLIKGNYLFKRQKGFKYSQGLKIALVASMQSLLIAIVLMLMGLDFITSLGLALTARIIYIYVKYTGSNKNTKWMEDMYTLTNDERFKI